MLAEAKVIYRLLTNKPVFVGYNVTNRCTMRCPFCSVPSLESRDMTLPEVEHALDRLREVGVPVVGITGGEPFLRTDLADILFACQRRGMKVTLVTNGELLTAERMRELRKLTNIVHFALSVDSLDLETYERLRGRRHLPETLQRFLSLRSEGPRTVYKLNVVVGPENADEMEAFVQLAETARVALTFIPVNVGPDGFHRASAYPALDRSARERIAEAFRTLRRHKLAGAPLWDHRDYFLQSERYILGDPMGPCGAGQLFLDMRPDGSLAVCNEMPPFMSLLETDRLTLKELARHRALWADRIQACHDGNACCYTCSYNVKATAQNLPAYILDYLRLLRMGG